jgi:hypothetical protein
MVSHKPMFDPQPARVCPHTTSPSHQQSGRETGWYAGRYFLPIMAASYVPKKDLN